jgi:hypothetical protein
MVNSQNSRSARYWGEIDRLPQLGGELHPNGPAKCHLHAEGDSNCLINDSKDALEAANLSEITKKLSQRFTIVVNGSKNPGAFEKFQQLPADEFDKRALLLVRDPSEWVRRYSRVTNLTLNQAANAYSQIYTDSLRRLSFSGTPFRTVWLSGRTYFTGGSQASNGELLSWITFGELVEYEQQPVPSCQLGGNPKVQSEVSSPDLDENQKLESIKAVNNTPGLRQLLNIMGYDASPFSN